MFPSAVGLLFAAVGIGYVALEVHTVTGLRIGLGLAFLGVLVWVTQLRSRVTAYPDTIVLKNSLVDTSVPLRLIEDVSASRTLNVWVGDRRYVCIGIGQPMRTMLKGERRNTQGIGMRGLQDYAESANRPAPDQSATAYENFVVTRLEELVEQAKKSAVDQPTELRVQRSFAWPEIAALILTGAAFLSSFFV
jgi:hypothetical protein